ncbi:amino acid adenylation domain-containing protein [Aquimarina rhabdastrellae]
MEIAFLVKELKEKGIGLNLLGDEIELLFLKDDIDENTIELVKQNKERIKDYLVKISKNKNFEKIPKAFPSNSYPISNAQKRLWIASQVDEASIAYNMPFEIELNKECNIHLFKKSVNFVIQRHEILRTVFKQEQNDEVHQFVLKQEELGFKIDYVDFSQEKDKILKSRQYINEDAVKPFDLEKGPLIRATLLKLEENKYIFYYNMHHIISDGWSLEILARDVFECYNAYEKDNEPSLPNLRIQYKDYAVWYTDQINKSKLEEQKKYWLEELKGNLPKFEFPTEKKRPSIKTYNGKTYYTYLTKKQTYLLKEFSNKTGGSLYMGALSTIRALLYIYTGQKEIVIGTPIAAREHPDLTDQIGFYVNTLAIRNKISDSDTFVELYSKIKETTIKAYNNQQYPFDELVDDLNTSKDLSRNPVFDVMVVLQNQTKYTNIPNEDELHEIKQSDNTYSKFDLLFRFEEMGDYLLLNLEFNTDVYEEKRIKQFIQHYKSILDKMLETPEKPISEIDYLSSVEKNNILEHFNLNEKDYNEVTVIEMFKKQVIETPDDKAVVFDGEYLTYSQLDAYSNQLAHCLKEKYKVESNEKVAVMLERSLNSIITMIGILKSGACYVPIDHKYPKKRITHILNDASIKLIIANNNLLEADLLEGRSIFDLSYEDMSAYDIKDLDLKIDISSPSFVVYTSGSTGKPKGVVQTHRMLSNLIQWHINYSGIDKGLNHLQYASFSFDVSIQDCWFVLNSGGTLYIVNEEIRLDFLELSKYILDNKIETISMPYAALNSLYIICTPEQFKGHSIKHISSSGEQLIINESLHKFLEANPEIKLHNHYGPAETHVVTSHSMSASMNNLEAYAPIGKPISNTNIYILDSNLNPVTIGVQGEIYIGGDNLAIGYLNMSKETKNRFINNPFKIGQKLYKTGDYAYWRDNGDILFARRKDDQVKVNGYRVELKEIERLLIKHQYISEAIVGVYTVENEKRLCAYVKYKDNQNTTSDLRRYLLKHLPQYMIPSYFVELNKIPLTSNGKIDKKALPDPLTKQDLNKTSYVAPSCKIEEDLVEIWKGILEIDKVGVNDVIFELGGNSLTVARIVNQIKQQLGYVITVAEIFENPTIKEIIPYLKQNTFDHIPQAPISDLYPLSSTQFRFWILSQNEKANKAYNIPLTIKIEGKLNIQVLKKSLKEVIKRHDSLRTSFIKSDSGEIKQYIQGIEDVNFDVISHIVSENNKTEDLICEVNNILFDLTKAPLLKVDLIIENEQSFYLNLVLHHIIGDGKSIEILLKEIVTSYNGLINKNNISLPELNIQFKDYVAWSLNEQAKKHLNKEKEHWLKEFSGELPVLNLPTYKQRPVIQTFDGDSVHFKFKDKVYKKLVQFSKRHKTTLFMNLMAGLNGLLSRYTHQTDIILGTPVLGRDHPDLENQVGVFINTLPIRTRFDLDNSFLELLDVQKRILLKAYANTNYPFGDLVNELNLVRDMSRSPVFDALVIFDKQTSQVLSLNDSFENLDCSIYQKTENQVSKFDITFSFVETRGGLNLGIQYNTNLYQAEFIESLVVNYENFIEQCIENPELEINKVQYLNRNQIYRVLNKFNDTEYKYNIEETVISLIQKQVEESPEDIALVCEEKEISYKELDQRSTNLALHLQKQGVLPNTTIGVCLGRSIEMVIAILGILKSGASYLPLDPFYPLDRLDYILKHSNTKIVLVDKGTKEIIPKTINTVVVETLETRLFLETQLPEIKSSSLAYVIYTSGSTGKPKGVKVSHRNLTNFINGMTRIFTNSSHTNVWLATTSISFDISILELLWTLTRRNKVIIHLERPVSVSPKPIMDFSLFYFPTGTKSEVNKYKLLIEGASFADKNGFSAIWVPERHFHDFGDQFPNPSVAAAAVSTITQNIKLRSGSVVLPLHDTVRVAEEWSMVDNLSNGRVELSIASGWHPNDFVLAPDSYENRHQIMREKIDELKKLWGGNSLGRKNGIGKNFEFTIHPIPVQNELPIWITAAGSIETFKYAGAIGANLLTHLLGQSIEDLSGKIEIYRETLRENGFDPKTRKVALMLHTFVSDDESMVKEVVETPFKNYLKNSLNLLKPIAEEQGLDIDNDQDVLLNIGFLRYYKTNSLFGTPESCLEIIDKVYKADVDEIACLIDFGIEEQMVIDNLSHLYRLKELIRRSKIQYDFIIDKIKRLTSKEDTAALIEKYKVTHLQSTPSFYEEFLSNHNGEEALKQLNTLLIGGEVLKKSLAEKLLKETKSEVYNMYGPTETTIWSSVKPLNRNEEVTIGKPIVNTEIYILDNNNQLCPIGVSGELCIGGDGVSLGYMNNNVSTRSKFIKNPFKADQIIYKTGDLACWLPSGDIQYQGRLDSQVKIKGYRIELEEIENVILEYTGINQCAVSTFQNKEETVIAAYIKNTENVEEESVKGFLRLRLPHYMIPQHIITLNEFPQTANGKINYKELPFPNGKKAENKKYVAPRNEIEKKLLSIWSDFLDMDKISIDDNFFEIGGNSMKVFQLLTIINTTLNTDLKIISFFQYPTIRTLAENLDDVKSTPKVQIEENEMEDVDELIDFMNEM